MAEESFSKGDTKGTLALLEQAEKSLGRPNSSILYLRVKAQTEIAKAGKAKLPTLLHTIEALESLSNVADAEEEKVLEILKIKLQAESGTLHDEDRKREIALDLEVAEQLAKVADSDSYTKFIEFFKSCSKAVSYLAPALQHKKSAVTTQGYSDGTESLVAGGWPARRLLADAHHTSPGRIQATNFDLDDYRFDVLLSPRKDVLDSVKQEISKYGFSIRLSQVSASVYRLLPPRGKRLPSNGSVSSSVTQNPKQKWFKTDDAPGGSIAALLEEILAHPCVADGDSHGLYTFRFSWKDAGDPIDPERFARLLKEQTGFTLSRETREVEMLLVEKVK